MFSGDKQGYYPPFIGFDKDAVRVVSGFRGCLRDQLT